MRHARRILQERGPDPAVHAALKRILRENPDVTRKLRALWALHVTDGLTEPELLELLEHDSEYVRSWAVYLTVAVKESVAGRRSPVRAAGEDGHLGARAAVSGERASARAAALTSAGTS